MRALVWNTGEKGWWNDLGCKWWGHSRRRCLEVALYVLYYSLGPPTT